MSTTAWGDLEAAKAFRRVARARRRGALRCRLRRGRRRCGGLAVYDSGGSGSSAARAEIREIPLAAIEGTLEPHRAAEFDCGFRPAARMRGRWERVWLAEQRGTLLPPIAVVQVGGSYAIRDGHHRVSVAKARGALTINAVVGAL